MELTLFLKMQGSFKLSFKEEQRDMQSREGARLLETEMYKFNSLDPTHFKPGNDVFG